MSNVTYEQPMIDQPMVIPEADIAQEQSLLNRIHAVGAAVTEFAQKTAEHVRRKLPIYATVGTLAVAGAYETIETDTAEAIPAAGSYNIYQKINSPGEKQSAIKSVKKEFLRYCKKDPKSVWMKIVAPKLTEEEEYENVIVDKTVLYMSCNKRKKTSFKYRESGDEQIINWRQNMSARKLYKKDITGIWNASLFAEDTRGRYLFYDTRGSLARYQSGRGGR